ncbi:hypothetical protein PITCH_A880007 [uncultured Desulfobacterium sp.]|uniref:Uncharacterized protein n=1 Tax=uncultured Desulfobacterium sp. TaxID=201089 RepID=A0A445N3H1_9BACT|nr:hypothetical protein PITCH_A880007 [uncultured Desulfobacterium sp.]
MLKGRGRYKPPAARKKLMSMPKRIVNPVAGGKMGKDSQYPERSVEGV